MANPLEVDPECAQFAKLIIRQSQETEGVAFGFNKGQVRRLTSTEKGLRLWNVLTKDCFREVPGKGRRFDFSVFCRELCEPEFEDTRRCFKAAKQQYPNHDPREVCFRQVWDLCKRVEHVWTDINFRTEGNRLSRIHS